MLIVKPTIGNSRRVVIVKRNSIILVINKVIKKISIILLKYYI